MEGKMIIYPRSFVSRYFFEKVIKLKKFLFNEHFEFYVKNYLANDLIAENSNYLNLFMKFAEDVYSDLPDDYKFKIGITSFLKEFKDGLSDWAFAVIFTSELNPSLYAHLEKGRLFISDTRLLTQEIFITKNALSNAQKTFADELVGWKKKAG